MSKKYRKRVKKSHVATIPHSRTLLDIIIPVYNRFDLLKKCLEAIPKALGELTYQIIIVDNGSDREIADKFYSNYPFVKIIRNKENLGFPKACNKGFNRGVSPLVFFLNDDVMLEPSSIVQLVKNMDDPKVGVVGMKLIFPENTDLPSDEVNRPKGTVQHVGLTTNIRGDFPHILLGWNPNNPRVNAIREITAVTGAALLTRRNLFLRVGRFFEGYGMGTWEDIDLCFAIRDMGYSIIVDVNAVGYHYTGATAVTYKVQYPIIPNKMLFLQRWGRKLTWDEWKVW